MFVYCPCRGGRQDVPGCPRPMLPKDGLRWPMLATRFLRAAKSRLPIACFLFVDLRGAGPEYLFRFFDLRSGVSNYLFKFSSSSIVEVPAIII